MEFTEITEPVELQIKELLLNELNEKYDVVKRKHGDILLRRIKNIKINDVNDLNKYKFAKSTIKSCFINNTEIKTKLKYKKIMDKVYDLINNGTQIIKNTKLNIKTTEEDDTGFYYLDNLGISVQAVDSNKCILEIVNQCRKNNISILMNITLKTGLKLIIDF